MTPVNEVAPEGNRLCWVGRTCGTSSHSVCAVMFPGIEVGASSKTGAVQTNPEFRHLLTRQIELSTALLNEIKTIQQTGQTNFGTVKSTGESVILDKDSLHAMDELVATLMASTFDQVTMQTSPMNKLYAEIVNFFIRNAYAGHTCQHANTDASSVVQCQRNAVTRGSVDEADRLIKEGAKTVKDVATVTGLLAAPISGVNAIVVPIAVGAGLAAQVTMWSMDVSAVVVKLAADPAPGTTSTEESVRSLILNSVSLTTGTYNAIGDMNNVVSMT